MDENSANELKLFTAIVIIFFSAVLVFKGEDVINNLNKTPEAPELVEPIITDWQPEVEFVTVAPVERIGGLEIGQVTVRRTDNNFPLPVLAIPFQEVPIGTKVKIIEIENVTDFPFRRSLIMLKPIESEKKE